MSPSEFLWRGLKITEYRYTRANVIIYIQLKIISRLDKEKPPKVNKSVTMFRFY